MFTACGDSQKDQTEDQTADLTELASGESITAKYDGSGNPVSFNRNYSLVATSADGAWLRDSDGTPVEWDGWTNDGYRSHGFWYSDKYSLALVELDTGLAVVHEYNHIN